jgi:hypothetical protein
MQGGIVEAEAICALLPEPSDGIPTTSQSADAAKTTDDLTFGSLMTLL